MHYLHELAYANLNVSILPLRRISRGQNRKEKSVECLSAAVTAADTGGPLGGMSMCSVSISYKQEKSLERGQDAMMKGRHVSWVGVGSGFLSDILAGS